MQKETSLRGTKQSLVPKLRFSEFEDNWTNSLLGKIKDVRDGTHSSPKYVEKGFPFVTSKNLNENGTLNFNSVKYISEHDYKEYNKRSKVNIGDILFGMIGTIGNPVKVTETGFAIKNVALIKECNLLPNKFIIHYLSSSHILKQFFRENTGGTQKFIALGVIRKLKINYPSLEEQQKIANFLTSVDERIQTLEKKKSLLEQYKKGVMQKIFKQEIRFKDENGNEFAEWEYKNGNLLFKSISDKNHNSDLPILAVTQDQGAIPRHLIDYNIGVTAKSVSSYKVVNIGDFIISLRSFQGGIEYSNYKGICSPAYIILKPIDELDRTFYKYYLKTSNYIQELTRKLEGIRDGKMISYKYFSEIKLPYPSVKEQTKIANFLSAIDKNIALVNTKIEHTKAYKKGLLQQMFV